MVDEQGAEVLEEMEMYGNAGRTLRVSQGVTEDERMPEKWDHARNTEGEIVGFIGQKAILRAGEETRVGKADAIRKESEERGSDGAAAAGEDGVMAALARLRQQN